MPLCGLLLQCARDNLGAFSVHFDVVDLFKVIEQPEGQGQTLLHHPANIKSECAKMDLDVTRSRPHPFFFWPHFSLGHPLEAFQRLVTSALFPGDAMDMCMLVPLLSCTSLCHSDLTFHDHSLLSLAPSLPTSLSLPSRFSLPLSSGAFSSLLFLLLFHLFAFSFNFLLSLSLVLFLYVWLHVVIFEIPSDQGVRFDVPLDRLESSDSKRSFH